MAASTPLVISEKAQEGFIQYHRQCYDMLNSQWNVREQLRMIDLSYIRENDLTTEQSRARLANRYGDATKFQNVQVPIVMSQVRAAVVYQASVFLTGKPIFGVVASPEYQDQAMAMQAIIEENSIRGKWVQQLLIFFNDLFKYNLGIVEVTWGREVTAAIETDIGFASGQQGKPKEIIWQGNKVNRWDPYNTFWDIRYKPTEVSERGEFAGKTELMSRIELKAFINKLPDKMVSNVIPAFESGMGSASSTTGGQESYYIPRINPEALLTDDPKRTTDWMAWAFAAGTDKNVNIQYKNLYEVTTLYARILPSDFGLRVPSANTPQVWKIIIVNHQVVIYAERQTNAHEKLPVLFGQAYEDGLGYQTKSLAQNARPFQEIGSALVNSTMAARRRAISDRGLYDPSRVTEAHINSDNPSAKIPVRPNAYGKPVSEAYYPIPFEDNNSVQAFQELAQVMSFANMSSGQNQVRQGQFVKGNKTQSEFDTVMGNANGPDQTTALLLESQIFTPMKEIIKINTLQFQGGVTIYSPAQERMVQIDPLALRKAVWEFQVSDGLTPTDKLISSDSFAVALQTISSSPQIGQGYNVAPLFSYMMKTRNVNLKPFEKSPEQIAYEQALGAWQQTTIQIAEMMSKSEGGIDPAKFPPQPTPQQFGYTPMGNNPTGQSQAVSNTPTTAGA